MFDCKCLIHPFQTDPGISQHQRIINDLLSDTAKIDSRNMADLLDYFVQLSRHINYYHTDLTISDWQPFFQKSIPFSLATIIKYDRNSIDEKLEDYSKLFNKHPSKAGLQLLVHFFFQHTISRINVWHLDVKGSGLPVELLLEKLIRDKLKGPLGNFIELANAAVKWYCIKPLDLSIIFKNDVWGLDPSILYNNNEIFRSEGNTKRKRMFALYRRVKELLPAFLDGIRIIAASAEQNMEQSLFPLKEELKKNHPPHLALLFAFLKLFQHLQSDLNSFTKKHLDFFYQQVLKIKPRPATADKAHLVFDIQKQLDNYLLKKGILAKDGKDKNKAEILFALDDEIVINKTQVADKRTLFLNNQSAFEKTYIEGVYMAPDATKADGVDKDFKDEGLKSFPTLGAKLSKYTHPEKSLVKPYPNARIGFILASPVLLLHEGTRTIDITLACELKDDYCSELTTATAPAANNCCRDDYAGAVAIENTTDNPDFIKSTSFYSEVAAALNETYHYISEDLIQQASKKGINKDLENKLRSFLTEERKLCYCEEKIKKYEAIIIKSIWDNETTAAERLLLEEWFPPRKALTVLFSGEKEWIAPDVPYTVELEPVPLVGNKFLIKINTTLAPSEPAVTFYDKDKLKEDFNTTLPLVKVELDDKIKILLDNLELEAKIEDKGPIDQCCLLKEDTADRHEISLYHFFRNVIVLDKLNNDPAESTKIDVNVCGLKNFIVQNDESVQDVNRPIYPFGARPRVGASFYIGSKELFSKNWQEVYVNAEWKDKPKDFGVHYKHYSYKDTIFEDGSKEIVNSSFLTTASVLDKGLWKTNGQRRLFKPIANEQARVKPLPPGFPAVPAKAEVPAAFCQYGPFPDNMDVYDYTTGVFAGLSVYERRQDLLVPLVPYNVSSQYGFIRFTLEGVSFQHDIFPFVLTRHMMAYAGLLSLDIIQEMVTKANDAKKIIDVMIPKISDINLHIGHIQTHLGSITGAITTIAAELVLMQGDLNSAAANIPGDILQAAIDVGNASGHAVNISNALANLFTERDHIQNELDLIVPNLTNNPGGTFDPNNAGAYGIIRLADELKIIIDFFVENLEVDPELKDGLPSEPYTPVFKSIFLDYTATAANTDIDLIHLYPYRDTYKHEEIELQPALFPTFCDEGTLFIGLKDLVPGSNLNILFQLAEATADSEFDPENLHWHYLDNNVWKELRNGFEVLDDGTDDLTTSGIVKFALPENMTTENSIMPKGLHWIKASIPKNSKSVSETIDIHTQAIRVTFNNDPANDKLRLSQPLAANSISRLNEPDANVKKVSQPYESFGGRVPEAEGHFYTRVSELLRHKGRAIQKFDYERLALEAFPQIFKAKCINHSFALNGHKYVNDFPVAPGYVLMAVIPDLNQLKAAQSFEPRVPVSLLDDIRDYLQKRTSPFVRLRVMNPRFEKVHFCLNVKLYLGKDINYYRDKLKQDLREFMAPWAVGQYAKLNFGQCVNRSDIVRFLESRDYLDFILELKMEHDYDLDKNNPILPPNKIEVCPKTPRSILIAGEIDVCIPEEQCEYWGEGECDQKELIVDYCKDNQAQKPAYTF